MNTSEKISGYELACLLQKTLGLTGAIQRIEIIADVRDAAYVQVTYMVKLDNAVAVVSEFENLPKPIEVYRHGNPW